MKIRLTALVCACLLVLAAPALAAKSPTCETLGAQKAAEHLSTHLYAYTCDWDGVSAVPCVDEACAEYGHLHCYGTQVSLRVTPERSKGSVVYYSDRRSDKVGPETQFQLIDVVQWRGKYYAAVRVLENYQPIGTGYVSTDYIGCDCESYETFEAVPEYDNRFDPFTEQ
ncbi:MAG: hypothetical protein IKU34_11625 [Clostridia bacterium]|nr:hypothetical protein [Clostridia bacterium]